MPLAGEIALVTRVEFARDLDMGVEDLVGQPPRGRRPKQLYEMAY
jgi:hypothetical protein